MELPSLTSTIRYVFIVLVFVTSCDQEVQTNSRSPKKAGATGTRDSQIDGNKKTNPEKSLVKDNGDETKDVVQQPQIPQPEDNGTNPKFLLTWNANSEENLSRYNIYLYEDDKNSAKKIAYVETNDNQFDPDEPSKTVIISKDYIGKKPCFMITAVNAGGESETSVQECLQL